MILFIKQNHPGGLLVFSHIRYSCFTVLKQMWIMM